jgi:hypothetical protein
MILRFARGGSKPVHNSQSVHTMLANSETVGTYSLEIDNSQFTLSLCLHYIFSKYTHFWGCVSDPCELRTGADLVGKGRVFLSHLLNESSKFQAIANGE